MEFDSYMTTLNRSQLEAVTATEGAIRVIAGAGSGKTRALAARFAWLVNDLGILPGHILCVTFTSKAANEMRQRIHRLTGDNDTGYINTFHGFCVSILKEDSHAVSYPKNFVVLDNADIDQMLGLIYAERGLSLRDMTFSKARDMIEILKLVKIPDYYKDMISMSLDELRQKYMAAESAQDIIFYGYLYLEKKCFGLDYNDLIKFSLHIFREHPDICLKWQQRLEYIMIDEFQDIDPPQYELMEVLCGWHKNLFVVGDPDQTIYTWRGADIRYLLEFDKKFPGTRTVMMMENYRSVPAVLNVANSLIDKNQNRIKKDLIPMRSGEEKVRAFHGKNSAQEAGWIAKQMKELHESGVAYNDMAVLYRAHYVSRTIEDAFMASEIPYTIYSGVQFYGRAEVKDALAYMRMIAWQDDLSFRRVVNVPRRNIGKKRMEFLDMYAEEHGCTLYEALVRNLGTELFVGTGAAEFVAVVEHYSSNYEGHMMSDLLSAVLDDSGYEKMLRTEGSQERLDNVAELKQSVYEYEMSLGEDSSLEDFLSRAALFTNSDTPEVGDKVKLMTVHAAKGLEFPYVFVCGLNEGIFPSRKTRTHQAMEEERRLCFVALTRARDMLYLSEAEGRNLDGSQRYPSRFILDVDRELLEYDEQGMPSEDMKISARNYIDLSDKWLTDENETEAETLGEGDRVKHPVFGEGTIMAVDLEKAAYVIQFDGVPTPRSITFRVKLNRV